MENTDRPNPNHILTPEAGGTGGRKEAKQWSALPKSHGHMVVEQKRHIPNMNGAAVTHRRMNG